MATVKNMELGNRLKQFSAAKQQPVEVIVETHQRDKKVPNSNYHQTSPFIYEGTDNNYKFIGGFGEFSEIVKTKHKDLFENSNFGGSSSKGECDGEGCRL
ncbi:11483_t:CDS:2 [Diversispora eburnea]|uniref:11483_t:CDS:1 n=1 Tax=Diversispora eburnea TaxID=1213867 RepID=A0A9N8UVL6_9GLOM|nr:11483_t:CDS:2 [Diversispora eburnea]